MIPRGVWQCRICIQPGQPPPPDCSLLFPGPAHSRHREKACFSRAILPGEVCPEAEGHHLLSLQTLSAKLPSLVMLLGWKWRSSITRQSAQVSLTLWQRGSVAYVRYISCQHAPLQNWHCRLLGWTGFWDEAQRFTLRSTGTSGLMWEPPFH